MTDFFVEGAWWVLNLDRQSPTNDEEIREFQQGRAIGEQAVRLVEQGAIEKLGGLIRKRSIPAEER